MNEADMMHGHDWEGENLTGWIVTEKFNGCRAYWDGAQLWTRNGTVVNAPTSFTAGLPLVHLDCEIWAGCESNGFETARLATQYGRFSPQVKLAVFDAPNHPGGYRERLKWLTNRVLDERTKNPAHRVSPGIEVINEKHLLRVLFSVTERGGEGLVAYRPGVPYRPGRTRDVLKVKPVF